MYNHAVLIGRLVANPELKHTTSGTPVCSFRIACDRQFKDQNGNRKADFINVVAWKQTAEFINKYFQKGNPLGVSGSIQPREYTDNNGEKHYITEVIADRAFFVCGKESNSGANEERNTSEFIQVSQQTESIYYDDSDDIPF